MLNENGDVIFAQSHLFMSQAELKPTFVDQSVERVTKKKGKREKKYDNNSNK